MNSFKSLISIVLSIFSIIILITAITFTTIFQLPNLKVESLSENDYLLSYTSMQFEEISGEIIEINSPYDFVWPIVGYSQISSYYGYRNRPTVGASSFHSGIDIPAPEGSQLIAIDDGEIYFASWGIGGGYTISMKLINHPQFTISYCHVSPNFIVQVGDYVKRGQVIRTCRT